jgi:hypothetical protein
MRRLYNFFLALLSILFVLAFTYSLLISRGIYKVVRVNDKPEFILAGDIPFQFHLKIALWHALIFSAVQFFTLTYLFRLAYRQQKIFTLKYIIQYTAWFYGLTTAIFLLLFTWFRTGDNYTGLYSLSGHIFSLPAPAWWPFPLVWIALFIFLAEKIKNNPEYGRKD